MNIWCQNVKKEKKTNFCLFKLVLFAITLGKFKKKFF